MPETDKLRRLPSIQALLEIAEADGLLEPWDRPAFTNALRAALGEIRTLLRAGGATELTQQGLLDRAVALAAERRRPGLRRVINATGIVLHTNLGRAPLAEEVLAAVTEVAGGYCNLEADLTTGRRGSRTAALELLLNEVAGAPASLAVNNGAAAILLALSVLAGGGEVVVSRGELVEIGGGFRIPDVIRQGGARLVEVGSTNKTRVADYRAAIGPETRVLLKVHQSNFRTIGFVEEASTRELAVLAREHGLKLVVDLGSGLLAPLPSADEPTLGEALAAGADLVTCSGDKLLGGPQAGLVLGTCEAIARLRTHPLLRAVRLDKMSLAALEATLRLHRDSPERVPLLRMLGQSEAELERRAERLRALLGRGSVGPSEAFAGGGSLPEQRIASRALTLDVASGADAVSARLRGGNPAVVVRIEGGRLVADMLTVSDAEVPELARTITVALA